MFYQYKNVACVVLDAPGNVPSGGGRAKSVRGIALFYNICICIGCLQTQILQFILYIHEYFKNHYLPYKIGIYLAVFTCFKDFL